MAVKVSLDIVIHGRLLTLYFSRNDEEDVRI